MKRVLSCTVAALLLYGEAPAASPQAPSGDAPRYAGLSGPARARFIAADIDADGSLNPEEFRNAFPGLKSEAFGSIDTGGDGRISPAEWAAFFAGHGEKGAPREQPASGDTQHGGDATRFPHMPLPRGGRSGPRDAGDNPGARTGEQASPPETLPLLSPPAK